MSEARIPINAFADVLAASTTPTCAPGHASVRDDQPAGRYRRAPIPA
jgi:hypothetical protein